MNKNKEAKNICIACHKIMMKFFLEDISKEAITSIKNGEIFHVTYDDENFRLKNRINAFL